MKTYKYDLLVITDKGNIPSLHISPFGFPKKDFIEAFEDAHPDTKVKEVRVLAQEGIGKSRLLELLNKHKTKESVHS